MYLHIRCTYIFIFFDEVTVLRTHNYYIDETVLNTKAEKMSGQEISGDMKSGAEDQTALMQ